jgi:hypothetical protein
MHRALMGNILAPEKLDRLFRDVAQVQHERELLFSKAVELTSQVDCRKTRERLIWPNAIGFPPRSQAFYDKLQLIELKTFQALVRFTATRDGDQEIHVLTNLPFKVSAVRVADQHQCNPIPSRSILARSQFRMIPWVVADQFNQRFAFAIGEDAEHRSSGEPHLGLPLFLPGRRFVNEQLFLVGQDTQ